MNQTNPPYRGADFVSYLSRPRVAASFWGEADAASLPKLRGEGLEVAEIRLDMAEAQSEKSARALIAAAALPSVLTIRPHWEGGFWRGDEDTRCDLFCRLLPLVSAADIELNAKIRPQVIAAAKAAGAAAIVSHHNFDAADSEEEMNAMAERAFDEGADVFKIAAAVKNESEFAAMERFLQKWKARPVVVIGMGDSEFARRTRLEFPAQGSRIAFAVAAQRSAPGQLSLAETVAAARRAPEFK